MGRLAAGAPRAPWAPAAPGCAALPPTDHITATTTIPSLVMPCLLAD